MRMLSLEEIAAEYENGCEVIFVDFSEEQDALIYELVKPLPDGNGTESELILYDGDMDDLLFTLDLEEQNPDNIELEYAGCSEGSGDFSSAVIFLRLNGLGCSFGDNGCDYPRFWERVCPNNSSETELWKVKKELLPAFLQNRAEKIDNMLIENIPCFDVRNLT